MLVCSLLSACSGLFQNQESPIIFTETVENYPKAEVVFQVRLPSALIEGEKLVLEYSVKVADDNGGEAGQTDVIAHAGVTESAHDHWVAGQRYPTNEGGR